MSGVRNSLAVVVLALGIPLAVSGCEGVLSPEAEAEELLSLQAVEAAVDLSGTWLLNEEESDEPGPQRNGAPPHGEVSPPGGPPQPPMGEGGPMAVKKLTIEQLEGRVTLTDGEGRTRTLYPNGEWSTVGGEAGTLQVRATWEEDALRVEIRGHRGPLSRIYSLGDDGDQLLITTRIEDGPRGGPVEFTRVYDRAASD